MKSKARNIAEELLQYFSTVRGAGHTTTMLQGVSADSLILTHNAAWADELSKKTDATCIPMSGIIDGKLRGHNKPLVLDNAATIELLNMLVSELAILESKLKAETKTCEEYRLSLEMIRRIVN